MTHLSISLIIPCYNDVDALRDLLPQLGVLGLSEIIVVDGGSFDGSQKRIRKYAEVTLLSSQKGRGRQIAMGAAHATSEIVWILHADSQIPADALSEIRRMMTDTKTSLGCFPLAFDQDSLILRFYAWLSKFDSPFTTFGDQGFFCRRADILAFGNSANYPLLEDVAFRQFILQRRNGRVRKSKSKITTSARRFTQNGPIKTQILNAKILWRYFRGASPTDLYAAYYCDVEHQILSDQPVQSLYSER